MDRPIPQDKDVERATLGSCIISKSALVKALKGLTADSFYEDRNKVIFCSIAKLTSEGKPVDIITLSSELGQSLDSLGGLVYLTDLTASVGSTAAIDAYINILEEKRTQRNAIELGSQITEMGFKGEKDINDKIREKAVSFTTTNEDISFEQAFVELEEQAVEFKAQKESGKKILGESTGIAKLDEVTNGIQKGHFYVVAGYTSSGKTQLTLNIVNSLLEQGKRVLMMSLEMSPRQVAARMTAIKSDLPIDAVTVMYDRYRDKELDESTSLKIQIAKEELKKLPITMSMNASWYALRAKLAEISLMHNIDVVVIDFIQNLQSKEDEYTKLTNISVELQNFCIRTQCTVIATSQIPKDAQVNKYDDVIALKGSGSIAEKSDVVMLISYDNKNYKKEDFDRMKSNEEPLPVILNIAKNRNGRTGAIDLRFKTWTGKFIEGAYDDI